MKRIAGISILSLILLLFLTRWIGQGVSRRAPGGGINESMYVNINGSKQWISIYGQDKDNPVLLYLHGGPGASTSLYDYAFTRKWSDVYTVVTWDQRGCGKSYHKSHPEAITADVMMQDGKAITEFLREYLQVEKITLLGHSWGSYLGANLVLAHPEYYEAFIGAGQFIDRDENERRLHEAAMVWSENDTEGREMVEKWGATITEEEDVLVRSEIMERYGYGMMKDATHGLLESRSEEFSGFTTVSLEKCIKKYETHLAQAYIVHTGDVEKDGRYLYIPFYMVPCL